VKLFMFESSSLEAGGGLGSLVGSEVSGLGSRDLRSLLDLCGQSVDSSRDCVG